MSVHFSLRLGNYDFASTCKDWCLSLRTDYGNLSEMWPENDMPDIDGMLPSDIVDLIESRLDSYWYTSRRAESKEKIARIRAHAHEIDLDWLDQKINAAEAGLAVLRQQRQDIGEAADKALAVRS